MRPQSFAVITAIGINRPGLGRDQGRGDAHILDVSRGEQAFADQARSSIHRHMQLLAEGETVTVVVSAEPGIWIRLACRPILLAWASRGACDHRGVDQRALLDQKVTSIQLALQFGEQTLDQSVLRQTLPKPPDRAVVRRLVLQRQPSKTLET